MSEETWFDQALFLRERALRGAIWGRPVRALQSTSSTNDLALKAISGEAKTGIVWIAREQTKGRGRRGNSWQTRPGECLMVTTLLRYQGAQKHIEGMSLIVGLAVQELVQEKLQALGDKTRVRVKWPNDVMVNDKKIAGVLIESKKDAQGNQALAIGMGLNLLTVDFPSSLPHATSLALWGVKKSELGFEALLASFLQALEKRVTRLLTRGIADFHEELAANDYLLNKQICIAGSKGRGAGVDKRGHLLLRTEKNEILSFAEGHVDLVSSLNSNQ